MRMAHNSETIHDGHIEGEHEGSFGDVEMDVQKVIEKISEELERYTEDARALLASHKRFLETFAQDISLRFEMGSGFKIDTEKGVVYNDAKWFHERDFSPEQILWAHLHELMHFRDLVEDQEGNENTKLDKEIT